MKGLLLKDIINLKQQGKIYLLIIGIWMVIGIMNKDGSFFGGVISMLTILVPLSAVAYDDKAKWDRYALTMPVSKLDLVLSKYLLAIICAVSGSILSAIVSMLISKNITESLISSLAFMSLGIFFASVVLPIIFKFGVEKGRMLMLIVVLVPTVLTLILPKLNIRMPSDAEIELVIRLSPVIAFAVLVLSVFISKVIYEHKEF